MEVTKLTEVDDVIRRNANNTKRIMERAKDYLVVNHATGLPVITTFDNTQTNGVINLLSNQLVPASRSCVRDIDPTNDLTFLRIKTRKGEYLIAPEKEYTIVVQQ